MVEDTTVHNESVSMADENCSEIISYPPMSNSFCIESTYLGGGPWSKEEKTSIGIYYEIAHQARWKETYATNIDTALLVSIGLKSNVLSFSSWCMLNSYSFCRLSGAWWSLPGGCHSVHKGKMWLLGSKTWDTSSFVKF